LNPEKIQRKLNFISLESKFSLNNISKILFGEKSLIFEHHNAENNKTLFESLKKLKLLKMALNFKVTQEYLKACLSMRKVLCVVFMDVC